MPKRDASQRSWFRRARGIGWAVESRRMADKCWKAEERVVARLIGGGRYPANSGGRIDAESPQIVAQVKHVKRLSLAELEALAVEVGQLGAKCGKVGMVVVKRRAGRGTPTHRLVVMTHEVFEALFALKEPAVRGPLTGETADP